MPGDVIATCAASAGDLRRRFDALSTAETLSPVLDQIPPPPAGLPDPGAGSGRDAACFAERGHGATAVEPDAEAEQARGAGLRLRHPASCGSMQARSIAAGVTWTWPVVGREDCA
ncbi:hypothetical protein AB1M95_19830 [Sulfitobacter sp. LCG007]